MLFPELQHVLAEQGIVGCKQVWVGIKDKGCRVTGQLHKLPVASEVGQFQVEGDAALLCSLQVTRSAQLEVGFRYLKAIVSFRHYLQAFACLGRELEIGDKDAIGLLCAASNPAAKLMQL